MSFSGIIFSLITAGVLSLFVFGTSGIKRVAAGIVAGSSVLVFLAVVIMPSSGYFAWSGNLLRYLVKIGVYLSFLVMGFSSLLSAVAVIIRCSRDPDYRASIFPDRSIRLIPLAVKAGIFIAILAVVQEMYAMKFAPPSLRDIVEAPSFERVGDPLRGFYLKPDQVVYQLPADGKYGDPMNRYTVNRYGMRDEDHLLASTNFRVALLGDSFLRGFEVRDEESLTARLRAMIAPADVMNFGESGYGTVQEYYTYETLASRFKPNLVILFMMANDLVDNHYMLRAWRNGRPGRAGPAEDIYPDIVPENDRYILYRATNAVSIIEKNNSSGRGRTEMPPSPNRWNASQVYRYYREMKGFFGDLVQKVSESGSGSSADEKADVVLYPAAEGTGLPRYRTDFVAFAPPSNRYIEEAWLVTEHVLEMLNKAVTNNGGRLAVFIIPDRETVQARSKGVVQGEKVTSNTDYDYLYRRVRGIGLKAGFDTVNIYDLYQRQLTDIPSIYFKEDMHWNEEGHALTARILADYLRRPDGDSKR